MCYSFNYNQIIVRRNQTMSKPKNTYRLSFYNQGKIYEIYANSILQSELFGFIEVEGIVFGSQTSLVVDPSEEHLKTEFDGVTKTHIPIQAIIRIDEVEETGQSKITDSDGSANNVANFPVFAPSGERPKK